MRLTDLSSTKDKNVLNLNRYLYDSLCWTKCQYFRLEAFIPNIKNNIADVIKTAATLNS